MTHTLHDQVTVAVPYGQDGDSKLFTATITARVDNLYRVSFDEDLIYGGTGEAWVTEDMLR